MELNLQDKTAMVTGGGQGVGRRLCLDFAAEGVTVLVNDLFAERAQKVAEEIQALGGKAVPMVCDITDYDALEAAFAGALKAAGREHVDILVNNAGVTPERRAKGGIPPQFLDMPMDDWRKVVDLNVYAVMYCCRLVLPGMRVAGGGKIVSIMSEAGRAGEAGLAVYSGAKAAILGFSKAIAQEHGRDRINVNVIALGAVSHEGIANGALHPDATPENNERLKKMLRAYPIARGLERLCRPEDISGAVLYLASDRAAYVTGQSLGVSGGFVMI
ncbi:SDR family NAD(P)-dependent oxidoreductase [Verticiella sediminum]|uniref:SDR family NAD(P)-dependent oxidoreductase n=1 Tax=Verticiella sediminum TaxID=1247510 RepID=A0A556AWJ7_9BURK|nr:SDR family NAD(P)-dependent oxidoreductase [Verticiella sediminum]TSH97321.1 SDR family NAD(P)-dependent oxidoreductase [Verticiella sediminum]